LCGGAEKPLTFLQGIPGRNNLAVMDPHIRTLDEMTQGGDQASSRARADRITPAVEEALISCIALLIGLPRPGCS
jgi:hypothetical protein